MGQKVNPISFRLGINRGWDSIWFSKKREYGKLLIGTFIQSINVANKNIIKKALSHCTWLLVQIKNGILEKNITKIVIIIVKIELIFISRKNFSLILSHFFFAK